ncbi:MAG: glycosyltransferase family 4 protein [bacterium]|nr:glycosyltransferase family 4 protein [bacterium]
MSIKVLLDTSPLSNGNSLRGVGAYTRALHTELAKLKNIELLESIPSNDRVSLQHYPYFDLFFPTLPLRQKNPYLITIHDVIPLLYPDHYPVGIRGRAHLLRQTFLARNATAIITDSLASKADIVEKLGISEHKIHVIYLAGNPEITAATPKMQKAVVEKYHLPEQYLTYLGDINYNKNVPQLIKALKYLPDELHLVCIGKSFHKQEIPEWKAIELQLALSDVSHRVIFINDIATDGSDDISAILSGSLAYVQPSLYEGFGLPVLEAMQCKTPVVCSRTSSLIEVADEHAVLTGTLAEELAQGVKKVTELSATKRSDITSKAFNYAQKFTWQKTAKQTAAIYEMVAS